MAQGPVPHVSGFLIRSQFLSAGPLRRNALLDKYKVPRDWHGGDPLVGPRVTAVVNEYKQEQYSVPKILTALGFTPDCVLAVEGGSRHADDPTAPDFICFQSEKAKTDYCKDFAITPTVVIIVIPEATSLHNCVAVRRELSNTMSQWCASHAVIATNHKQWMLLLRGKHLQFQPGELFYEFNLYDCVRSQESLNHFFWYFSAEAIGQSVANSFVYRAFEPTESYAAAVAKDIFAGLIDKSGPKPVTGITTLIAKFVCLATENALSLQELKQCTLRLLLRITYFLLVEAKCSGSGPVSSVVRIAASGAIRDRELWTKLSEAFSTVERFEGCEFLQAIPVIDEHGVNLPLLEHKNYLVKAVQMLTTSRLEAKDNGNGDAVLIDFNMLTFEHLGSLFERVSELQIEKALIVRKDASSADALVETNALALDNKEHGVFYTPPLACRALANTGLGSQLQAASVSASCWDDLVEKLCNIAVVDPAMGCGFILIGAAWCFKSALYTESVKWNVDSGAVDLAVISILNKCFYGVDVNPVSASIAKLGLTLMAQSGYTLGQMQPLFQHLRSGDSLWGCLTPSDALLGSPEDQEYADVTRLLWVDADGLRSIYDVRSAVLAAGFQWTTPAEAGYQAQYEAWKATSVYAHFKTLADARVQVSGTAVPPADYFHFHWFLEYPWMFSLSRGRFSAVLGNPPWSQVLVTNNTSEKDRASLVPFQRFLLVEHQNSGMFKRAAEPPKFNLYDLFIQRSVRLTGDKLALIIPTTFMCNNQQSATRRILAESFAIESINIFKKRDASELFGNFMSHSCIMLHASAAAGATGEIKLALNCTKDNLGGKEELLPRTPPFVFPPLYEMPILSSECWPAFRKLAAFREATVSVDDRVTTNLGRFLVPATGYKPSSAFQASWKSAAGNGLLPFYKGTNLVGAYLLGGKVAHYYSLNNVPGEHAALCSTQRIGMKHVADAKDRFRSMAVVLDSGTVCDDSVYYYTLNPVDAVSQEDRELPLHFFLAVINSFVVDSYLRWYTGMNLPQGSVASVPLPGVSDEGEGATVALTESVITDAWKALLARVPGEHSLLGEYSARVCAPFEAPLDGVSLRSRSRHLALLMSYGAKEQVQRRAAWLAAAVSHGLDVRKAINAHLETLPPYNDAALPPACRGAAIDELRRSQIVLNHLVARWYGLDSDELKGLHAYMEPFWKDVEPAAIFGSSHEGSNKRPTASSTGGKTETKKKR